MTTLGDEAARDWSYRDALRRLVRAGRRRLHSHTAASRLDDAANPIVQCGCGWVGNARGWAGHLEHVVSSSLDRGTSRPIQD